MDARIVEFANLLRENGVRVSTAESLDAFEALGTIGVGERESLRVALRATMVKRGVDVPLFDELFDAYFGGLGEILREAEGRAQDSLDLDPTEFQKLLEDLERALAERGQRISPLVEEWLRSDRSRLEQRLRDAMRQLGAGRLDQPYGSGPMVHALAQHLGLSEVLREIESLREGLGASEWPAERRELLDRYLGDRLRDLSALLKEVVRQEVRKRDVERRRDERSRTLGEKSFYYLTEEEIRQTREAIERLARRLKNVIAVRRKRAKRGKLHVKNTLRKNVQYGSVPFRIEFDRRKKEKPQVVVLCDVSDSVRNASRFMLQFVYSLQDLYSRVRSFIFVAEPGEITRLFKDNDIHDAIDLALRGEIINVYAHSDFGRAFTLFHREHLDAVNKRTTVIVLGDARNNYNLPQEWALREIAERAKQLIWLNPESRMTWGFGDSEMDRYQRQCHVVEECRNLNQLYRVIDRMVTG